MGSLVPCAPRYGTSGHLAIPCAIVPPRLALAGRPEALAPGNPGATPLLALSRRSRLLHNHATPCCVPLLRATERVLRTLPSPRARRSYRRRVARGGGAKRAFILPIHPIADFDTWLRAAQSTIRLAAHPGDLIAYWAIILAFLGVTLHVAMMLVEFYLAVMLSSVLIPWGIWRLTSGVAEFSLGWLTGSLIRALVTSAMVGIATGTFDSLNQAPPDAGFFSYAQTFRLVGGSLIYVLLCWVIPVQAARLAGQASLGLTGSTLLAAAMSGQRFATMAASVTRTASRVISPMLQRP